LPEGWKEVLETETGRKRKKKVAVYILEFRSGLQQVLLQFRWS